MEGISGTWNMIKSINGWSTNANKHQLSFGEPVLKKPILPSKKCLSMADAVQKQIVQVREGGGSTSYQCPMLNATNYTSWAIKMESFMDAQGLWDAIHPPAGANIDVRLGKKAGAFIFQALPKEILLQVAGHTEARVVWEALRTRFLGADRVQQAQIQTLNREFELLSMKETDSIDDFASKVGGVVSKFRTLGTTMDEKTNVKQLLNAPPILLIKNPVFHGRSKHINTRYHFIRECVENGLATIEYVAGKVQKADILTKALSRVKFLEMREVLGVEDLSEVKTEIKGVNLG
ncbi:hypothetical protein R6Q59_029781 [Mikania micrantha]